MDYLKENAQRWNTLPGGYGRQSIRSLLKYPDWLLKLQYESNIDHWTGERGWEYKKYSETFAGRDVLELGGGMGYDGIVYSAKANSYTYAELNETQVSFLKRIAAQYQRKNIHVELLDGITHSFPQMYNAFYAHGVLHHVPFETARKQFLNIDKYLLPGSKVVMLMYPKNRWEKAGRPPFEKFGKYTDGGCPWAEWYDEEKILQLTGPGYILNETKYWGIKYLEFVNFELTKL